LIATDAITLPAADQRQDGLPSAGKSGFQKRVDRLTRDKYALQAEIRKLQADVETKDREIAALENALLRLDALVRRYERGEQ
jgi:hypothetical protein